MTSPDAPRARALAARRVTRAFGTSATRPPSTLPMADAAEEAGQDRGHGLRRVAEDEHELTGPDDLVDEPGSPGQHEDREVEAGALPAGSTSLDRGLIAPRPAVGHGRRMRCRARRARRASIRTTASDAIAESPPRGPAPRARPAGPRGAAPWPSRPSCKAPGADRRRARRSTPPSRRAAARGRPMTASARTTGQMTGNGACGAGLPAIGVAR